MHPIWTNSVAAKVQNTSTYFKYFYIKIKWYKDFNTNGDLGPQKLRLPDVKRNISDRWAPEDESTDAVAAVTGSRAVVLHVAALHA